MIRNNVFAVGVLMANPCLAFQLHKNRTGRGRYISYERTILV